MVPGDYPRSPAASRASSSFRLATHLDNPSLAHRPYVGLAAAEQRGVRFRTKRDAGRHGGDDVLAPIHPSMSTRARSRALHDVVAYEGPVNFGIGTYSLDPPIGATARRDGGRSVRVGAVAFVDVSDQLDRRPDIPSGWPRTRGSRGRITCSGRILLAIFSPRFCLLGSLNVSAIADPDSVAFLARSKAAALTTGCGAGSDPAAGPRPTRPVAKLNGKKAAAVTRCQSGLFSP
jgi:hypothetical protein